MWSINSKMHKFIAYFMFGCFIFTACPAGFAGIKKKIYYAVNNISPKPVEPCEDNCKKHCHHPEHIIVESLGVVLYAAPHSCFGDAGDGYLPPALDHYQDPFVSMITGQPRHTFFDDY